MHGHVWAMKMSPDNLACVCQFQEHEIILEPLGSGCFKLWELAWMVMHFTDRNTNAAGTKSSAAQLWDFLVFIFRLSF